MAFTTPYISDGFIAYPGDVIAGTLSLAIRLEDDFEKCGAAGSITVTIREGNMAAFKNLSGYYLFMGLNTGNYTVAVESEQYFTEETIVDTSSLDPKNPVVLITLIPKPSCRFPGHATLVRGVVKTGTEAVPDAEVTVTGKSMKTRTDEQGEFVLRFKGIRSEDITIGIKKGGDEKSVSATIEEGKTISVGIISFP